jgi:hypothetical protein
MRKTLKKKIRKNSKSRKKLNQRRIKSAPADLTSSGSMTDKEMNAAPEGRFQIFSGLSKILGGTRHAVYTLKPWMTAYSDRLVLSEVAKNPFGIQHLEHVKADMDRLLESICENPGDAAYGIIRKNMDTILSREPLVKALCKNINPEVTLLLKPKIEELLEPEAEKTALREKFVALTYELSGFTKQYVDIDKVLSHNKKLKRRTPALDSTRDELQKQIDSIQEARRRIDEEKTDLENKLNQLEYGIKEKFSDKKLVVHWPSLAENPNPEAVKLISKTQDWGNIASELQKNPSQEAFQLFLDHALVGRDHRGRYERANYNSIARNPCDRAVEFLLERKKESDNMNHLSSNPNPLAVNLLVLHPARVDWHELCKNPNPEAIRMLKEHFKEQLERKTLMDPKFWVNLSRNPSKEALEIIKENLDFISEHNFSIHENGRVSVWDGISRNPLIFQHDYKTMRSVNRQMGTAAQAAATLFHPSKRGKEDGWDSDEEEEDRKEAEDSDVEVNTPRAKRKAQEDANLQKVLAQNRGEE